MHPPSYPQVTYDHYPTPATTPPSDPTSPAIYPELKLADTQEEKCKYRTGRCMIVRAVKSNGDLHALCQFHREKANKHQRAFDNKRRQVKLARKSIKHRQVPRPSTSTRDGPSVFVLEKQAIRSLKRRWTTRPKGKATFQASGSSVQPSKVKLGLDFITDSSPMNDDFNDPNPSSSSSSSTSMEEDDETFQISSTLARLRRAADVQTQYSTPIATSSTWTSVDGPSLSPISQPFNARHGLSLIAEASLLLEVETGRS